MDMVIFRTIFFELFSFLHVHAPYPPFRLLMNSGKHRKQDKDTVIRTADNDSTCHGHCNFQDDFLRTFSFLHVHALYYPFRLLTNLGKHRTRQKTLLFVQPIDDGTQANT